MDCDLFFHDAENPGNSTLAYSGNNVNEVNHILHDQWLQSVGLNQEDLPKPFSGQNIGSTRKRETSFKANTALIYVFSDGSTKKSICSLNKPSLTKQTRSIMKTRITILLLSICSVSLGQVPDWTQTTCDGTEYNMQDELDKGNAVLIDFTAMWCTPCNSIAPVTEQIGKTLIMATII